MRNFCLNLFLPFSVALFPFSAQGQRGEDCVQPTNGPQESTRFHRFYFRNICDKPFKLELQSAQGKFIASNGIGRGSKAKPSSSNLIWEIAKGECANAKWIV